MHLSICLKCGIVCYREFWQRQTELQGASFVYRVAIVRHKVYRGVVDLRDSFLDCLPRCGRILPRRIPLHAAFTCVKESRMSRKNGDRARFDRQRRAKIHTRTRIRELWKTIRAQETPSAQHVARAGKTPGSPETTKKSRSEAADGGT